MDLSPEEKKKKTETTEGKLEVEMEGIVEKSKENEKIRIRMLIDKSESMQKAIRELGPKAE